MPATTDGGADEGLAVSAFERFPALRHLARIVMGRGLASPEFGAGFGSGTPARRNWIDVKVVVLGMVNLWHLWLQVLAAYEVRSAERRTGQSWSTCTVPFHSAGIHTARIGTRFERRLPIEAGDGSGTPEWPDSCVEMAKLTTTRPKTTGGLNHWLTRGAGRGWYGTRGMRVSTSGDRNDQPLAHSIWRSSPETGRVSTRINVIVLCMRPSF